MTAKSGSAARNFVGGRKKWIHNLEIKVPFTGKYVEGELIVSETSPKELIIFVVKTFNYGLLDIEKSEATIDILKANNEKITTILTDAKPVKVGEVGELKAGWFAENPGDYNAVVRLRYDDKITLFEKVFSVEDDISLNITSINVKDSSLNGKLEFELSLENLLDKSLDGSAEIIVKDKRGNEIGILIFPVVSIPPLEKKTLAAQMDEFEQGQYDVTIIIYSDGRKIEKQYNINEENKVELVSLSDSKVSQKKEGSGSSVIIIFILLLIVINAIWIFYFKRRLNKNV